MKQKFETLRATLDEFVRQDEYPMLIIGCRPEDCAYVLTFLRGFEEVLPSHAIAGFGQPFVNAAQWVGEIVEAVRLQLEYAGPARAERGEPPLPSLPLALQDPRRPAKARLHELHEFLPGILPDEIHYRVVVGLLPARCDDIEAFAELMAAIVPFPAPPAFMRALRVIVWDDRERALLRTAIRAWPADHVLSHVEDFSTPALTDALVREAGDRALPLDQRMGALVQLAALDYSHGRHGAALDKYAVLHEHYFQTKQPALQGLALLGAGDTLAAAGQLPDAKQRLAQGIAVALASSSLPLLVNLLGSIARVCMRLGQPDEAESYADSGIKAAAAAINPFAYCDLHEQRGDAELAQGKLSAALASYTRARELCRANEHLTTWRSVLDKQIRIYEDASMREQVVALERERDEVEQLERRSPRRRGHAA